MAAPANLVSTPLAAAAGTNEPATPGTRAGCGPPPHVVLRVPLRTLREKSPSSPVKAWMPKSPELSGGRNRQSGLATDRFVTLRCGGAFDQVPDQ
jgi:hypothetical protein